MPCNIPTTAVDHGNTFSYNDIYHYGIEVGKYIKAWNIIINNSNAFEAIFIKHQAEMSEFGSVKWMGDKIELIELFKALYVSGRIVGTQTELIKLFEAFFKIDLRNHSKAFNDLKNRNNGSETLFLNTLKEKLKEWITK